MTGPDRHGELDRYDELDRARYTLTLAYERARAAGYQPDSPQMLDLNLAEQHYKHAQRGRGHPGPGTDPDRGDIDDDGNAEAGGVNRVIDLRESMLGAAKARAWPGCLRLATEGDQSTSRASATTT